MKTSVARPFWPGSARRVERGERRKVLLRTKMARPVAQGRG